MKIILRKVPKILYHATYTPLIESIRRQGLGGTAAKKMWEDSKHGVVYLADAKEVAESYAETSDVVDADWLDKIVVFKIDSGKLDITKLSSDANVIEGKHTWEYLGIIPFSLLVEA